MIEKEKDILFNKLLEGAEIGQIVEVAAKELFDNPVMVTNASFRVIAMASDVAMEDRVWDEAVKYNCCSAEAIDIFSRDEASRKLFFGEKAFVYDTNLGEKIPRILKKISLAHTDGSQEVLGYAVIFAGKHPILEKDIELADLFSNVLSLALRLQLNQAHLSDTITDHMIFQLLEQGYGHVPDLDAKMKAAGWTFRPLFFCMSVELPGSDHGEYYISYIRNEMEQSFDNVRSLLYRDRILLLVNFESPGQGKIIRDSIRAILERHGISGGVSRDFTHIADLYPYYEQARLALEIGSILGGKESLYYYGELCLYHMFYRMSGAELRGILSPDYVTLEHLDRENDSGNIQTLSAFYLSGLNMNDTASMLHIHRNTLYYRLERIDGLVAGSVYDIRFLGKMYIDSQISKWLCCMGTTAHSV